VFERHGSGSVLRPLDPEHRRRGTERSPDALRYDPDVSGEHSGDRTGFRALVFSDFSRYRPTARPTWFGVLVLLPIHPGVVGSLVLRAQQSLVRAGHANVAWGLRTLGNVLVGADFVPGAQVGPGVMFSHPVGVVLGPGSVIGRDATLASGVVLGVRSADDRIEPTEQSEFPVVGDGVFLGAHAVVLGGVRVGDRSIVGANAVVTADVAPDTIVAGNPARVVKSLSEPPARPAPKRARSAPASG
jgi:serine O-acetyltransferase